MDSNKHSVPRNTRLAQLARHLRERLRPSVRDFRRYLLQGAAYGLGSGAVSILIIWVQSRF